MSRSRPFRTFALAVACALSMTTHAVADTPRTVNVEAGNLADALETLAKQCGVDVIYPSSQLKGLTTEGVSGVLETRAAFQKLLKGTRLVMKEEGGSVLITLPGKTSADVPQPGPIRLAQSDHPQTLQKVRGGSSAQGSDDKAASRNASSVSALEERDLTAIPEIVVKDSRVLNTDIKRSRDDAQPYVVFEREKIEQSTAINLEQFLRDRLPMNVTALENSQRPTSGGNLSTINLRGLGASQTLILINGHRAVGGGSFGGSPNQPDINAIPMAAIERIEILPGTASGIHGGGATGGVVNIIMRTDYTGTEVKVTYGNTFDSDVANRRIDLSSGFNLEGGRTNVLLTSSFSDQNLLQLRERQSLVDRFYSVARANDPALLLPPSAPPLGNTPNIRSADGTNLQLKPAYGSTVLPASFTHLPEGYAGVATSGVSALVANAGVYSTGLANTWQTGSGPAPINTVAKNTAFGATFRRQFSSKVDAYLETAFSDVDTSVPQVLPPGVMPYRVAASSPNNPFTSDVLVTFPTGAAPSGEVTTEMRNYRATGGVIVALPAGWQGAADYTWARSRRSFLSTNLSKATMDVVQVQDGTLDVLRDTSTYPVGLASVMAANLSALQPLHVTLKDAALRFSGPIFNLSGGPVGVSTLLEYREDTIPDAFQVGTFSLLYPAKSQSVRSAYLETRVPFVSAKNRKPGIESLELQLAARADGYRTDGSTAFVFAGSGTPIVYASNETDSVNPTIALRYQPVEDLALRVSYATGFVAPDVSQLAGTTDVVPSTVNDPRRGGLPVTLPGSAIFRGGNSDLRPEKSKNWSAGFIFTPRVLPGLRLSLDYLHVEKTDNIASYPTGIQGVLDDESLHPDRIVRGANLPGDPAGYAGPITQLNVSLFNIAKAEVEAFDVQADYNWSTRWGNFSFLTVATQQTHYKTQTLSGQPLVENVGTSFSFPRKLTGNAELKWQLQDWTAGWITRYHDSYFTGNPALASSAAAIRLQGNGGLVPSQTYHDMFFTWRPQASSSTVGRLLSDTEVQLNVRNVLDKTPPFEATLYMVLQSYYSPLGDALQRSYQISLKKRF